MRTVGLLSVVIPCHNEEEVVSLTHRRLTGVLEGIGAVRKGMKYEILYVDNGSTDATGEVLKKIFDSDSRVRIVVLSADYGYQGALCAGLARAEGDCVVTMDADLQDPPEKIGEMVACFEQGYDLVLGVRSDRSADSLLKRVSSEGFYRFARILGKDMVFNHGDFRLMSGPLVRDLNASGWEEGFIRSAVLRLGRKYAVVYYRRGRRAAGNSKFGLRASLALAFNGLFSGTRAGRTRQKSRFCIREELRHAA
jgi:glycosyltransferase involved in cell wall biosynthesis